MRVSAELFHCFLDYPSQLVETLHDVIVVFIGYLLHWMMR